jgi:hypothetical protein
MEIRVEIIDGDQLVDASFAIADRWDDVPEAVYPNLATLYLMHRASLDKYERNLAAFTLLAFHSCAHLKLLPEEMIDLPHISWVFEKLDLKKNLQPVIRIGEVDFIGPSDELENMRFAEWCAADTFYCNYAQDDDIYQLHQLAAVLYRPVGIGQEFVPGNAIYRGDTREKFNEHLLKQRTVLMSTLPEAVIKGIYLFFASCRHFILQDYTNTFPEKKKQDLKENPAGWLDIYDDLRSDNKYIGADRLDEEMMHSVLFSLERSNIKMNKLKKEHDL